MQIERTTYEVYFKSSARSLAGGYQVTQAGSNTYGYDANGNMSSRNGYSIYWNSANYPTEIRGPAETFLFSYGPDRQRVRQVSANAQGSETTYYIGGALEKALLVDGTTDYRHTVYAGGQAVAIVSRSSAGTNTTRYLIEDHQGSSTRLEPRCSSDWRQGARQVSFDGSSLPFTERSGRWRTVAQGLSE